MSAVIDLYSAAERLAANQLTMLDLLDKRDEQIKTLFAELAELRDFVHGLNDRHTSLALKLRADGSLLSRCAKCKGLGWLDGRKCPACATAPVAEVGD